MEELYCDECGTLIGYIVYHQPTSITVYCDDCAYDLENNIVTDRSD